MLTKEFFTEIAGNPVDYHQMINKRLVREYYDYTSEYLFADCHCSLEEAKKVLNNQVYNNDKMFDIDDDFAKFLAVNNIEDVAKAVLGREPDKNMAQMIANQEWQQLYQITISYYLPEEIDRFVKYTNQLVNRGTNK